MNRLAGLLIALSLISCASKTSSKENPDTLETYVIEEVDFVPEGIAYSKNTDAFYLTSVGKFKILEIDRTSGAQSDFIEEHGFGYTPGAGIYIDDQRNLLHAIGGYYRFKDSVSSLFTFDLRTKKLLKRYDVGDPGEHFLNDLIQDKKGNIYLTDSKDASVYVLKKDSDTLERFFKSPEIEFPNGITISDDNTKLYIASIPKGIRIMDMSTKTILNAADTTGLSQGIDGLEFYNGNLFGVQNSVGANSFNFRKLILNTTENQILKAIVIDSHTPRLDVPLTFCIVDDKAVVIGNSNLQYLDQERFRFAESDTIQKTKLLVYPIE